MARGIVGPAGARLLALVVASSLVAACAGSDRRRVEVVRPIRVSDAAGLGDPARRASTRLTMQGLEADAAGEVDRARGSYERAVQVDATNPYAYLALARHYLDGLGLAPYDPLSDPLADPLAPDVRDAGATAWRAGDSRDAERAAHLVDQAAALFEAEGMREPRVGVHLMGLRGWAMRASGQDTDASLYLERAAALSPEIWGDAHLGAEELR